MVRVLRRMPPVTAGDPPKKTRLLEGIASCAIGIPALIYGTGVLVSITYFGRWDMTDLSGGELVRARYLQVGLFALALPALCGSTILAYFYFRRIAKSAVPANRRYPAATNELQKHLREMFALVAKRPFNSVTWEYMISLVSERPYWPRRFYFWGTFSWLNMFLVLTIVAAIGRPPWFAESVFVVSFALLPTVTVLGSYFIAGFLDELGVHCNTTRFILFVVALFLDYLIIVTCKDGELWKILASICTEHGSALMLYSVLSFAVVMMLVGARRGARASRNPTAGAAIWALVGISIVPLYYYAAIGFAFSVFPYIPSSKGGADHTSQSRVQITCVADSKIILPISPLGLVFLEETANWIYLADATRKDVEDWRTGYAWSNNHRIVCAPRIIRVSREKVCRIDYIR